MATKTSYVYAGHYIVSRFISHFETMFSREPHYRMDMIPDLLQVLKFINNDTKINDVRWAAYLLATTLWETTTKRTETITVKGKPKITKSWVYTMSPVEEVGHGKGLKYYEPVKVRLLPTGSVHITEHDGDQFEVNLIGKIKQLTKGAKLGATYAGTESPVYAKDKGEELYYFGRGYVQLTWWSNYALASIELGMHFDLLLHPDGLLNPKIAYQVMSYGMCTGKYFANGHSFGNYFFGSTTNYKGARAMVNGTDHAGDIAIIAEKFEAILMDSRAI